jgi:hypothetical protein
MAITRLITSRYPGRCTRCYKPYAVGARVYWTKGRKGAIHETCPSDSQSETQQSAPTATGNLEFHRHFTEIADGFKSAVNGTAKMKRPVNSKKLRELVNRWSYDSGGFFGCTTADMLDWLARGFNAGALQGIGSVTPSKDRRRIRYAEEGEFQYDLMRSGFDYPFLQWDKRESIPGLKVEVGLNFNASTDASVVLDYEKWICRALYALETAGVDLAVDIVSHINGALRNGQNFDLRITVKRENESMDWTQWSAMFSPGGWRMLCFYSIVAAADHFNGDVDEGLGRSNQTNSWNVQFDDETRILRFLVPNSPGHFPENEMTEKLLNAIQNISH